MDRARKILVIALIAYFYLAPLIRILDRQTVAFNISWDVYARPWPICIINYDVRTLEGSVDEPAEKTVRDVWTAEAPSPGRNWENSHYNGYTAYRTQREVFTAAGKVCRTLDNGRRLALCFFSKLGDRLEKPNQCIAFRLVLVLVSTNEGWRRRGIAGI
jgi:hypothetical protein